MLLALFNKQDSVYANFYNTVHQILSIEVKSKEHTYTRFLHYLK